VERAARISKIQAAGGIPKRLLEKYDSKSYCSVPDPRRTGSGEIELEQQPSNLPSLHFNKINT
jgi:hypothetical protein